MAQFSIHYRRKLGCEIFNRAQNCKNLKVILYKDKQYKQLSYCHGTDQIV